MSYLFCKILLFFLPVTFKIKGSLQKKRKIMFIGNHSIYGWDGIVFLAVIYMKTGMFPRGLAVDLMCIKACGSHALFSTNMGAVTLAWRSFQRNCWELRWTYERRPANISVSRWKKWSLSVQVRWKVFFEMVLNLCFSLGRSGPVSLGLQLDMDTIFCPLVMLAYRTSTSLYSVKWI